MRVRNSASPAIPALEARRPGSRERYFNSNRELNGWDRRDALQAIASLLDQSSRGEISMEPEDNITVEERRAAVVAAFRDRTSNNFAELGATLASEITESGDREGFARRLMFRSELAMGQFPRHRVRKKRVQAIVASSPTQVMPQVVRDDYLNAPEFTISANIRIESREINQGTGDIMEEKYYEGVEAIVVQEDRVWRRMADKTVGVDHQLKYLIGGITPTSFAQMNTALLEFNLQTAHVVMAADFWNDFTGDTTFGAWFDPATKYEIIQTGRLGQMMGITLITDGFRQPNLKVLESGEIYFVAEPTTHGSYTDRGPVQSSEVDEKAQGGTGRGWFMFEEMSMAIGNTRSVVKGIRQ